MIDVRPHIRQQFKLHERIDLLRNSEVLLSDLDTSIYEDCEDKEQQEKEEEQEEGRETQQDRQKESHNIHSCDNSKIEVTTKISSSRT